MVCDTQVIDNYCWNGNEKYGVCMAQYTMLDLYNNLIAVIYMQLWVLILYISLYTIH